MSPSRRTATCCSFEGRSRVTRTASSAFVPLSRHGKAAGYKPLSRTGKPAGYNRKDAFHQRAKREGYRSRAAYKLEEIQKSRRLLRPGQRVLDLGCWPGGWLQVAAQVVGARGKVVGIDQAEVTPPLEEAHVTTLVGDLAAPDTPARLREALGGAARVVLSDAAPKTTGIRATDRAREEALLQTIAALVPFVLTPGGDLLLKLLDCPEAQEIRKSLQTSFGSCKVVSVRATRKGSSERYLLARGFKGGQSG